MAGHREAEPGGRVCPGRGPIYRLIRGIGDQERRLIETGVEKASIDVRKRRFSSTASCPRAWRSSGPQCACASNACPRFRGGGTWRSTCRPGGAPPFLRRVRLSPTRSVNGQCECRLHWWPWRYPLLAKDVRLATSRESCHGYL